MVSVDEAVTFCGSSVVPAPGMGSPVGARRDLRSRCAIDVVAEVVDLAGGRKRTGFWKGRGRQAVSARTRRNRRGGCRGRRRRGRRCGMLHHRRRQRRAAAQRDESDRRRARRDCRQAGRASRCPRRLAWRPDAGPRQAQRRVASRLYCSTKSRSWKVVWRSAGLAEGGREQDLVHSYLLMPRCGALRHDAPPPPRARAAVRAGTSRRSSRRWGGRTAPSSRSWRAPPAAARWARACRGRRG